MVSFVNPQCSETRSLAANKSFRVSILLAAEGKTIEGRFVFPLAFNGCARSQNIDNSILNLHLIQSEYKRKRKESWRLTQIA